MPIAIQSQAKEKRFAAGRPPQKSQGFLAKRLPSARTLRWMFNFWPTFRFAGVRVRAIAPNFTAATVELRLGLLNRNYVGTAFGGTLYAMTDPFYMLMMMRQLGAGYVVWDRAGSVRYLKPGRGLITAEFKLAPEEVERIRGLLTTVEKLDQIYTVDLRDATGELIAQVEKTLYIRKIADSA
jgi:acyl-coenzyme A thioesterase PaaI-like protein